MNLKKYYILFFILLGCLSFAQVSFEAIADTNQARVGQDIAVNFVITLKEQAEVGSIEYPSFNDFKVMGRTRSHQLSITNGDKTIQEIETVILRPEKKGKIRIGKAQVRIDNSTYQTKEFTIQVSDSPNALAKQNESPYIFLSVDLPQKTTYINSPVYATVKLYAKSYDALREHTDLSVPNSSNFQVHPIQFESNGDIEQEVYNQQVYVSQVIGKYELIPQRIGEIDIPTFYLRAAIPIDFFDNKIVELTTPIKKIMVKNLPANPPKSFNGAIGTFSLKTSINKNSLQNNQAFNVNVVLSGEGNLSAIDLPKLKLDDDLEIYNPTKREDINTNGDSQKGEITDCYTVVPQYGGKYKIPSVKFSYFNPKQGRYVTLQSTEINLNIKGKVKNKISDKEIANNYKENKENTVSNFSSDKVDSLKPKTKDLEKLVKTIEEKEKKWISKTNIQWVFVFCTIIISSLLLFFFPKIKRKNSLKEKNVTVTKKSITNLLKEIKSLRSKENKAVFNKKVQSLLQEIVSFYSKEKNLHSEEESFSILKEKNSEKYAESWKLTYEKLQIAQYTVHKIENQDDIYKNCVFLVNNL